MFSQILLDHFQRPRNAGELPGADAMVEVSNPVCGDVLRLAVKVEAGRIREVKFLCRGCTTAIACASVATEKMQGEDVGSLGAITAQVVAEALGGLPEASFHGAQLAEDGVKAVVVAVGKADSALGSE
jgi:nitrogen fixation NifU-like protein